MDWPNADIDFVSKVVHLADGSSADRKTLFDYGPLVFPRVVSLVSNGNVGLRAAGLDALCRLFKVSGLGRMLVSALCGPTGLESKDSVVRFECALSIGRIIQSCFVLGEKEKQEIGWIRILPCLIDIGSDAKMISAAEQALIQLRILIGARSFNRKFARLLLTKHLKGSDEEVEHKFNSSDSQRVKSPKPGSWVLWNILKGDEGFLETSVDSLRALAVAIEPHPSTRMEIIKELLPLLDSFDMEVSDLALEAIVAHFDYDTCWELVSNHPLADTIARRNQKLRSGAIPAHLMEPQYQRPSSARSIGSASSTSSSRHGSTRLALSNTGSSGRSIRSNGSSSSIISSGGNNSNNNRYEYQQMDQTSGSPTSYRSNSSSMHFSMNSSALSSSGEVCQVTIPQARPHGSTVDGCATSPANASHGFSATPKTLQRQLSSSSNGSPKNVFAAAANSMVRMTAQLSTLKRKTSARRRSTSAHGTGRNPSSAETNVSSPSFQRKEIPDTLEGEGVDDDDERKWESRLQNLRDKGTVHSAPLSRSRRDPRENNHASQLSKTHPHDLMTGTPTSGTTRRHDGGSRLASSSTFNLKRSDSQSSRSATTHGPEYDHTPASDAPSPRDEDRFPSGRSDNTAKGVAVSGPGQHLPNTLEGLVKLLGDESNWQGQLLVMDAVKSNQQQLPANTRTDLSIIQGIIKITSSLRSVLAKNSLLCVHFLINNNGASFWKDQSMPLIESVVNALVKKSTDSSTFLAQEAKAALDACVVHFPPQKFCITLLHHCNTHPNANARGITAQVLLKFVQHNSQASFDVEKVVQCAKEKLLHDNSGSARAAAKGILTQLNETKNLDKKQQLHLHRIKLSSNPASDQLSSTQKRKEKGSTMKPPGSQTMETYQPLLENLLSTDWQVRFDGIQKIQSLLQQSIEPTLLEYVAEKVSDPNARVRTQAIRTVQACAGSYSQAIPPSKLSTVLLPIASACGDRQLQKEAIACLQSYITTPEIIPLLRRHLKSIPLKSRIAVSEALSL